MGFFRSTSGRLVALSIAISLICGGFSAFMPHGEESTFVLCVSLFVPIVINTLGLPRALEKDWYHAAIAVMVLPMLFFLWAVGIGAIREHFPSLAYPFIALGFAALGVAARSPARSPSEVRAPSSERPLGMMQPAHH